MNIEEARLYLEHTSKEDFNLEEHQKENRYQAIQVVLKEIEKLNNIINEFDKWLLGEQMMFYKLSDDERLIRYGETKNKWLELKGVNKE